MKTKILFLALVFKTLSFAQIIPIPDVNFKNKLINASASNSTAGGYVIDINNDDEIDVSEAQLITHLNVIISNISDLSGIEYFINLQQLLIQYNSISNINISSLTNLVGLRCDYNNLTSIDLNGLTSLQGLVCNNNQISNLSFNGLNSLNNVVCNNNQLTTLDFSQNPLLTKLRCSNNNLISINLKNGINHDFSDINFNDCWKTGNPNLATICVDASELASVQNHINNCGTAQTINITSNCGLGNEEFAANAFLVYPNPSTGNFIIDLKQEKEPFLLQLYTILGEIVFSKTLAQEQQNEIDITNLARGCYIARIGNTSKVITQKIIKN